MSSHSLTTWQTDRAESLDEIEAAHRAVGGSLRGRRYATQQINRAYALLLSSQFQGFCRDLHSEAVWHLARSIPSTGLATIVREEFFQSRKLDRGNPNPGNIGADFNRLGVDFWQRALSHDPQNEDRRALLVRLNDWRNAIAHQDFDPAKLGGTLTLRLADVREWRKACHGLVISMDEVIRDYLHQTTGTSPW